MKTLAIVVGIVAAMLAASLLSLQTSAQPASQPAESREAAARLQIGEPRAGPAAGPATSPAKLIWRGLDLSAAPVSTDASKLADIWEERPPGSRSYEVRSDVTVIPAHENLTSAAIYWLRSSNRFYVQYDSSFSSTHHFYGPFEGDPNRVLMSPAFRPSGR